MCLAQGHNTVTPVRIEPAAPLSRVKHSTTEPLGSLVFVVMLGSLPIFQVVEIKVNEVPVRVYE